MGETLHILVTCCRDASRTRILAETVESLIVSPGFPMDDLIVVDNASTDTQCEPILARLPNVHICQENYGYWSAVNWALNNHERVLPGKSYENVYVIESDMVHYAYGELYRAEMLLWARSNIGSVRLQEFSVKNSTLYDKLQPSAESRRYAWTRLHNHFTNERAFFKPAAEAFDPYRDRVPSGTLLKDAPLQHVYITNLAPQVPALNRLHMMKKIFASLTQIQNIAEVDFQREYFKYYKATGLLDGGIYNCKMSYEDGMTGSYSSPEALAAAGYKLTRFDRITPDSEMIVAPLAR